MPAMLLLAKFTHNILEDNERGALCTCGDALSNLANGAKLAEEFEEFLGGDVVAVEVSRRDSRGE